MWFLLEFAEMLPVPFENPYQHVRRMHRSALGVPDFKKWQYNRIAKRLKTEGRIVITQKNGKIFLQLTKRGRIFTLLSKLKQNFPRSNHWDGKWRLLIWDVPESSRRERNFIRAFVKNLGFYQLQKSVFITPFELPRAAVDYLNWSGLDKFIRILRVDSMDNDKYLKKQFNLR